MISASARRHARPRVGLALGAGGVLGAAWMTGALAALQQQVPRLAGEFDVIVGTSAGSVLAAALRCGLTVDEIVAHQRDGPAGPLSALGSPDLGCGALPPWPRPGVGSPHLLLAALRAPLRVHPWVIASAWLPQGRADHTVLRGMVHDMAGLADQRRRPGWRPGWRPRPRWRGMAEEWAASGRTWIVALDYDSGQRVVFGRPGAPEASLPDAVAASCSVPGWFRPTVIGGHRYIDGGVRSAASADLLARSGLDEVYVLAPTASLVSSLPRSPLEAPERLVRFWATAGLRREIAMLRARGAKVTLLTPGPEDLAAMGGNLMDPARRLSVFETSLRTSAEFFAAGGARHESAA
jgi:NTE family protein